MIDIKHIETAREGVFEAWSEVRSGAEENNPDT